MFGIGMTELLVILVVGLLVLGPKRLPELARSLGRGLAEFRRASSDMRREFLDVDEEVRRDAKQEPARSADPRRPMPPPAIPGSSSTTAPKPADEVPSAAAGGAAESKGG